MADEYLPDRQIASAGLMAHQGMKIMADSAVVWKMIAADYSRAWACLPEYIQNAIDEDPQTCEIRWPSLLEPTFHIIDNGRGISHEFMMEEFCTVGFSTKSSAFLGSVEEANKKVGGKGIGRLSGPDGTIFECRDPDTIRTYVMTKDAQYRPSISMMSSKPNTTGVPTGVTVRVPVNPREITSAIRDAKKLLKFFPIAKVPKDFERPKYVMERPTWGVLEKPFDTYGNQNTIVVCGGYPYEVQYHSLPSKYTGYGQPNRNLLEAIFNGNHNAFVLHIPVGSLDISMNRENLNMTDRTMTALIAAAKSMLDDYIPHLTAEVSKAKTIWEARQTYSKLYSSLSSGLVAEIVRRKIKWGDYVLDSQYYKMKGTVGIVDTTHRGRGQPYGVLQKTLKVDSRQDYALHPNNEKYVFVIKDTEDFVPSRIRNNVVYGDYVILMDKEDPAIDGVSYIKLSSWLPPEREKVDRAARRKIKMKKWDAGDFKWKEHEDVFEAGTIYIQLFGTDIKSDPDIKDWSYVKQYALEEQVNFIGVPQTLSHKIEDDWVKLTDHLKEKLQPHLQRLANSQHVLANVETGDAGLLQILDKLGEKRITTAVRKLIERASVDQQLINRAVLGFGIELPKPTIDISVMTKDLRELFGPQTLLGVLSKCPTYTLDKDDWKVVSQSLGGIL